MTTAFTLSEKQLECERLLAGPATHTMLFGGSRSGKTFLILRSIVMRALKAPGSRHLVARFRFNHVKTKVVLDTFPKVMALCFPQVPYTLSKTDWFAKMPNGSEIWFGGLDDKERAEKVLGAEYCTVFLNECSEISNDSRELLMTRLAQRVDQVVKGLPAKPLRLRAWYDCNPPSKAHWTFRLFRQKVKPDTREAVSNPDDYACAQINPRDNQANISPDYLSQLAQLSGRAQRRFLAGEFGDATPNALFDEATIDSWRHDGEVPQLVRVVIGVDPSGSGDDDNADNDEIGIAVAGLGIDGRAYVIEDLTVKAGPGTWGRIATDAFDRHKADAVIGETNFGGDMVRHVIQTARPRTPFRKVTASRGKVARAEPFSALYEQGKVRHVGIFAKLEDELCAMATTGYTGSGSPNRADALIWALTDLFPGLVAAPKKPREERQRREPIAAGWMG